MPRTPSIITLLNLPSVKNSKELADAIHLNPERLKLIIQNSNHFYKSYRIPKKDGSQRSINQPNIEIKAIQFWILKNILEKLSASSNATAYLPKKNLSSNVIPHRYNRYFLCMDIEDFFPSIGFGRVFNLFKAMGYNQSMSLIFSRLCTYKKALPQGGVTSPALSNLTSVILDRRIAGLSTSQNVVYTRYADDLVFSTNNPKSLLHMFGNVEKILKSEGFSLNNAKTRIFGPDSRCTITGMTKNASKAHFAIGREWKRKIRAAMHRLNTKGEDPLQPYGTTESIEGWLAFAKSVDSNSYEQMKKYWENLCEKYRE